MSRIEYIADDGIGKGAIEVITNNQPRDILHGCDLTDDEWAEFDYLKECERITHCFIKYKGEVYDLDDFSSIGYYGSALAHLRNEWDGYLTDTYFSGILMKWYEGFDGVVMARFHTCD